MSESTRQELKDIIRAALVFGNGIFSSIRAEGLTPPPDSELFELISEVESELKQRGED